MTHQTDAERAELLQDAQAAGFGRIVDGVAGLPPAWWGQDISALEAFDKLRAARRAPAAPVPQGWKLVQLSVLSDARDTAMQWCINGRVPECGAFAQIAQDLDAMLAAAPQPPEAEENPLQEQLDEALQSLEFYKRRCDLLQSIQPRMRDPERMMVCDVLANGHLLQGGDGQPDKARYAPPEAAPVQLPEPVAYQWLSTDNFRISGGTVSGGYWNKLYTEQQVRDLLEAHGIGGAE